MPQIFQTHKLLRRIHTQVSKVNVVIPVYFPAGLCPSLHLAEHTNPKKNHLEIATYRVKLREDQALTGRHAECHVPPH